MIASIKPRLADYIVFALGIGLAIALRFSLLDFKSVDYFNYTKEWYLALKSGGFSAFRESFSNYNLPYLYLLYLTIRLLPDLPAQIAIKLPSLVADFIAAGVVYQIVRLRPRASIPSIFAAFAILFAPTVVLNSAFWGQADAVYACTLLACIYFLLRQDNPKALLLFGLALSLKAQAIFLGPLLFGLLLRGQIPWKYFFFIPLVMLLSLVPAVIAGRPFLDLLWIYPAQAGQYQQLSLHAPSALSWIPDGGRYYPYFYSAGLILAAVVALSYSLALYLSPVKITTPLLIELALISTLMVPFFLPKMHERYFYLADMLSIVLAFYLPAYYFVPILMITISFFAYQPALFGVEPVPIGVLALGVLVVLIALVKHSLTLLFPRSAES